ncbi:MAG: hypothetical protein F6K65_33305 [Moorea sp. SIO3C2]|nr:hypothetical protein [Moorena sp. SIO3C2]
MLFSRREYDLIGIYRLDGISPRDLSGGYSATGNGIGKKQKAKVRLTRNLILNGKSAPISTPSLVQS